MGAQIIAEANVGGVISNDATFGLPNDVWETTVCKYAIIPSSFLTRLTICQALAQLPTQQAVADPDVVVVTLTYNGTTKDFQVIRTEDQASIEETICLAFGIPVGSPILLTNEQDQVVSVSSSLRQPGKYAVLSQAV